MITTTRRMHNRRMESKFIDTFGKRLRILREDMRWTQDELAERVSDRDLKLDWVSLQRKREREEAKLATMEAYVYSDTCRRHFILSYFGDRTARTRCQACDNCLV